jgi:hypothetical protein
MLPDLPLHQSLEICCRQRLNHTCSFTESCPEDTVCILKHAILQTNNDELTPFEPRLDQSSNVLRVREIERRINFVKNVHRCWLELKECHDE